jgi:hypothetical protein
MTDRVTAQRMSRFFTAIGVLMVLMGVLDLGLQGLGISLWRIIGFEPWWLIGRYTFAFEIAYGLLTIFIANYLRKPRERPVAIVDLSDAHIAADPYFAARPDPPPPLKVELRRIAKAVLWGGLIAAGFLLVFLQFVPDMDAVLFPRAEVPVPPQTRKLLVVGAALAVFLPMVFGVFALRIRDSLSVTGMLAGWLVTSILLSAAVLGTPRFGHTLYGERFMSNLHRELGYPEGLPPDWSMEKAVVFRLRRAERSR